MTKLAIVILNWNGRGYLQKFLNSVLEYSKGEGIEIIVADNASTDDSIELLRSQFAAVRIIELEKNYGFAGGYNKALQQVDATYYMLLNSDVEVTPNWLSPLLQYMDANLQTAACMPKMKAYHNKNLFEYAGSSGGYLDKYGYPFCRGRIFDTVEPDYGQYDEIKEIFWASGAALLIRSELYHKMGGLDNRFFAHMEEIDLCWRLKNNGFSIICIPQSEVYHVGGGALPPESPRKTYLNYRNNLFMLTKNLPANRIVTTLFIKLLLDGIAAVRFLMHFKISFPLAILKAHISFYLKIIPVLAQRKKLVKPLTLSKHTEIYKKSIVFEYFIKGNKEFNKIDFKQK